MGSLLARSSLLLGPAGSRTHVPRRLRNDWGTHVNKMTVTTNGGLSTCIYVVRATAAGLVLAVGCVDSGAPLGTSHDPVSDSSTVVAP